MSSLLIVWYFVVVILAPSAHNQARITQIGPFDSEKMCNQMRVRIKNTTTGGIQNNSLPCWSVGRNK